MSKLTLNELSASLNDFMKGKQDCQSYSLNTENKTIVGAINEIYGKEIIANAIGEPLDRNDTFNEMSNDINNLLSTFKTNMMNAGVVVESGDKFKALIDKIKGLTEGEGNKGIQYTKLTGQWEIQSNQSTGNKTISIPLGLDFTPSIIICYFPTYAAYGFGGGAYFYNLSGQQNVIVANNIPYINAQNSNSKMEITNISSESISISNGFYTPDGERYYFLGGICTEIYAIGVGEEDTTLRDSLADILKSNGVDVSDEDNMAGLISKVDGIPKVTQVVASDNMLMNIQQGKSQRTFGYQDTIARFTCLFEGSIRAFVNARVNQSYTDIMYFELFRDGVIIETGWANVPAHTTTGSNLYYDFNDIKLGDEIQIRFKSTISTNVVYVLVPGLRGDIVK